MTNLLSAFRSLREQWQRSALSALGITVGSMAIVLLISIAKGVQKDVTAQVEDLGVNLLIVLPFRVSDEGMFAPNMAGLSYLREEDVARVRQVPGVVRAAPLTFVGGSIKFEGKDSPSTLIVAAGSDWFKVRPVSLAEGRAFGPRDESERVVVIGSIARQKLFGEASAVGKKVTINGEAYQVIGVTQDKGGEESLFSMGSFENFATIPFARLGADGSDPQLHRIMVQTDPNVEPKNVMQGVESVLASRLEKELFSVVTQEDLLKMIYKIMNILTWLLTGLTAIGMVVGGVGILTVMLMSVNERAKEIGIRKTVGARRVDIFVQFLTEAATLALLGGTLGLAISVVVNLGFSTFTKIKPLITPELVLLSFGVSLGVGILAGLLPAMRAASRDPVVALRSE